MAEGYVTDRPGPVDMEDIKRAGREYGSPSCECHAMEGLCCHQEAWCAKDENGASVKTGQIYPSRA
jgi:hypothetical protein